jgi:hypothetical protein
MTPQSLTTLLTGIVDYAGLFPPAALGMADAVRNYAQYLSEPDAWMLGRFIVPVPRLNEFEKEAQPHLSKNSSTVLWRLSALGSSDTQDDVRVITDFNSRYVNRAVIDTIEIKAVSAGEIRKASLLIPKSFQLFIEVPINNDPGELIRAIADAGVPARRRAAFRHAGVKAKVRTGGVTADAFPSSADLLRFIHACVNANVQFKATAGLHHPVRSVYNLTYKPDSEKEKMYGFLNVLLAAAFIKEGWSVDEAVELLEEESRDAFRFDDDGVSWRSHRLEVKALQSVRQGVAISFGSCSFREPMDDLKAMKLL